MRVKLALAIILSVVLIGFASWSRFFGHPTDPAGVSLESTPVVSSGDELLNNYITNPSTTVNASGTPLTGTDTLSRGLIIDYVNLATSGQDTQENIDSLARKYVDSIAVFEKVNTISSTDLSLTASTQDNLRKYAESLVTIENSYRQLVVNTYTGSPSAITLGSNLYNVMGKVGDIYINTAEKLRVMPVPGVLAEQHVRLVNYYLRTANSMQSISNADSDPTTAFTGLVTLNKTVDEEDAILSSINTILTANGI